MHVVERVPHRGDDLRHFAETGVRILTFDRRLSVAEKQRVRRHWPETFHNAIRLERLSPEIQMLGYDGTGLGEKNVSLSTTTTHILIHGQLFSVVVDLSSNGITYLRRNAGYCAIRSVFFTSVCVYEEADSTILRIGLDFSPFRIRI